MLTPKSAIQVRLEFQKLCILNKYAEELVNFEKKLVEKLRSSDLSQDDVAYTEQLLAEAKQRTRSIHDEVELLLKKTEKGFTRSNMQLVSQK